MTMSESVQLTVEVVFLGEDHEWRWEVAERLDEDLGGGPGNTIHGDRWIAGGATPTLDRALSAIHTAVGDEVRRRLA
jgi:hypothetical protein